MTGKITNENTIWHEPTIYRKDRERMNGHKSCILWFTGLSGSGKSTLAHAVEDHLHKQQVRTFVLDGDAFTQIYGGEAVYHEGKLVSRVRSGGYGFTLKRNIFYAYLPVEVAKAGTCVEVELIEGRYEAEVTPTVLFDPKGERLRA